MMRIGGDTLANAGNALLVRIYYSVPATCCCGDTLASTGNTLLMRIRTANTLYITRCFVLGNNFSYC